MDDRYSARKIETGQIRPKPYVPERRPRIIIVDDFGEMKSGEYLRFFLRFLSIVTILGIAAGALLYYGYTQVSGKNAIIQEKLVIAEHKIDDLTREKELLMARLVMSGNDPLIEKPGNPDNGSDKEIGEAQNTATGSVSGLTDDATEPPTASEPLKIIEKTVDLEKFSVEKDMTTGDLLVRFDIRNISKQDKDVSGRIFIVLKPDNGFEEQWLVVPKSAIKNGIPSEYKKGQYFSIAAFKPVKFRIKHPDDPELYKKACVFVFNEQADLIFEKLIDIT